MNQGCAFTGLEIIGEIPLSRLHLSKGDLVSHGIDTSRTRYLADVFLRNARMVVDSIIDDRVLFIISGVKRSDCVMLVNEPSFHIGQPEMEIVIRSGGKEAVSHVALDDGRKARMRANFINGMAYGYTKNARKPTDYVKDMMADEPILDAHDMRMVLTFGWRRVFMHTKRCREVDLGSGDMDFRTEKERVVRFGKTWFFVERLCKHIRYTHQRKRDQYDGWYYFGLQEKQAKDLGKKLEVGRRMGVTNFGRVKLYRYLDECRYGQYPAKYILRTRVLVPTSPCFAINDYVTDSAEVIEIRKPLTFRAIMAMSRKQVRK